MEDLKKSRTQKKIVFTRELNKLESFLAERETDSMRNSMLKLKPLYKDLVHACDNYQDFILNSLEGDHFEEHLSHSEAYISDIHKSYCSIIDRVNTFLSQSQRDDRIASNVSNEFKSDLESKTNCNHEALSELIKLIQLPKVELKPFDGTPSKYHQFINQFKQSVETYTNDSLTKLNLLQQYCIGNASKLISGCSSIDPNEGYLDALDILERRCGNPHSIANELISSLRSGKPIKTAQELLYLADSLRDAYTVLYDLHKLHEVSSQSFFKVVLNRITIRSVKGKWRTYALETLERKNEYPNFQHFVEFIRKEAQYMNDPVYGLDFFKSESNATNNSRPRSSSLFSSYTNICPLCNENHRLHRCPHFQDMPLEARKDFVSGNNLCKVCLGSHDDPCKSPYKCSKCTQKHSYLLHEDVLVPEVSVNLLNNKTSILPVIPVVINNAFTSFALLDSGATDSFCTERLLERVGSEADVINIQYPVSTINGISDKKRKVLKSLAVESPVNGSNLNMHHVAVVNNIPVNNSCLDLTSFPYLKDIPGLHTGYVSVDILIGQDHSEALIPLEVKKGGKGEPFACRYLLGWALSGSIWRPRVPSKKVISNFVTDCRATETQPQGLDLLWHEELQELDDSTGLSDEDKYVLGLWDSETYRDVSGHYVIPIPYKPNSVFPNNLSLAEYRLRGLVKSLHKKGMYERYDAENQKLFDLQHAEPVPIMDEPSSRAWYLPHHAVVTDKKPDKVRVVYDCAAKFQGESLNDKCFQGPDLINKLLHVLLRFRQHEFAVCADVECMYYQVIIPPSQRDCLRFLWFDKNSEVSTYRMTGHVFGGVWCAASSTYALRRTVLDDSEVSNLVYKVVMNSFYVDDLLHSSSTLDELFEVVAGTKRQLSRGGFNLTKFVTNNEHVFNSITENDKAKEGRIFEETDTKALGVKWNVSEDFFYFSFFSSLFGAVNVTRRIMLKVVASIFDPLGLINPVTIKGRILLQEATRKSLDWDEEVSSVFMVKWRSWLQSLQDLELLRFNRCIKPESFNDAFLELHHFADASESAYGCVTYLRCVDASGNVHIALIMSKSKVAPVKVMTIPRLELQAAVLAVRVDHVLRNELDLTLSISTFWSDSNIVLQWLSSESSRFKTFVANRTSYIKSMTMATQWRHIPGINNPADLLTRGVSSLVDNPLWFVGPDFLSLHKCYWPKSESAAVDESVMEIKKSASAFSSQSQECTNPIVKIVQYFSDWKKAIKAVAWLMIVKNYLLRRVTSISLSVDSFEESERLIIHTYQNIFYLSEMQSLQKGKCIKKSSSILKLSPMINQHGLLVVKGRDNCTEDLPIIPKSSLGTIIVNSYHYSFHVGCEWLLSIIRERYWIVKARSLIRKINCLKCRRLFAKPTQQVMSDLPKERTTSYEPPFSTVGIDCFGPFFTTLGRTSYKKYGCIFTCLVTRAVHIEVLDSLSTDSFLNAFVRFRARRGTPQKVYSDNGTNLVGANNELRLAVNKWNSCSKLSSFFLLNRIEWIFNPPTASNFGGIWESLIGVFRRVFNSLSLSIKSLSCDALSTLFTEIEYIMNSRPITKLSDDPLDISALTPNKILLLNSTHAKPLTMSSSHDYYQSRWKYVQHLSDIFWRKWIKLYLPSLKPRHKWNHVERDLKVGDLVLVLDMSLPRSLWPLALVQETKISRDGHVRSAKIKTRSSILVRPVNKLVLLEGTD